LILQGRPTGPIINEDGGTNYPFPWTGTTHANWTGYPGSNGVYIAFGEALSFMEFPFGSGNHQLLDVYGAGIRPPL